MYDIYLYLSLSLLLILSLSRSDQVGLFLFSYSLTRTHIDIHTHTHTHTHFVYLHIILAMSDTCSHKLCYVARYNVHPTCVHTYIRSCMHIRTHVHACTRNYVRTYMSSVTIKSQAILSPLKSFSYLRSINRL